MREKPCRSADKAPGDIRQRARNKRSVGVMERLGGNRGGGMDMRDPPLRVADRRHVPPAAPPAGFY